MNETNSYKEVKTIEFPNMIVRVSIPDLTEEEHDKRMRLIYERARALLRDDNDKCQK